MKKVDKIFLIIIAIELLILVPSLFIKNQCGSACDTHSLLDPFGLASPKLCTQICTETFYPITYIMTDLLILTVLVYVAYFIIKSLGGKK